jgi:hypothetical protein
LSVHRVRQIVISGNHELGFNGMTPAAIQKLLSNALYLQDSGYVDVRFLYRAKSIN